MKKCSDLVSALYCEECGYGGAKAARLARAIDVESMAAQGKYDHILSAYMHCGGDSSKVMDAVAETRDMDFGRSREE